MGYESAIKNVQKKVIVALANKLVWVVWAVLARDQKYKVKMV
jgi:hypothetical protein